MNYKKVISLWCAIALCLTSLQASEKSGFKFDPSTGGVHLTSNTVHQHPNPDFTHGNQDASMPRQAANALGDGFNQGVFDASRSLIPLIVTAVFQVCTALLVNRYTQQEAPSDANEILIDKAKLENIGTMTILFEKIDQLPEGPEKEQLLAQLNGVLGSAPPAA